MQRRELLLPRIEYRVGKTPHGAYLIRRDEECLVAAHAIEKQFCVFLHVRHMRAGFAKHVVEHALFRRERKSNTLRPEFDEYLLARLHSYDYFVLVVRLVLRTEAGRRMLE